MILLAEYAYRLPILAIIGGGIVLIFLSFFICALIAVIRKKHQED